MLGCRQDAVVSSNPWPRAQIRTRTDIRERYGIRGNATGDCLTFCCCGPCALTQERREVELEEGSFY